MPNKLPRSIMLAVAVATVIYIAHTFVLGSWIVDDAGISFAYARNLAEGHGLVAQLGDVPVEGFTNLFWVLLLAIPIKLRVFDPLITPKLLSVFCVALSFLLTSYLLHDSGNRSAWLTACSLCAAAGFSGFAIWGASGLENALYALVVSILAVVAVKPTEPGPKRVLYSVIAGFVLFLVFCTRPDGSLYFWIVPFLMGLEKDSTPKRRLLTAYIAAFAGPWLLLTLFRLFYFHDVMPNTFYAKHGEGSIFFSWLLSRLPLHLAGIVTMGGGILGIVAIALLFHSLGRNVRDRVSPEMVRRYIPALFFVTAILIYFALRGDWMGEYRFATPAFLFGPATVFLILWDISSRLRHRRTAIAAVSAALLVMTGIYSFRHTGAFVKSPATSFAAVRKMAVRIAQTIPELGANAAVLTPDIGGALWENRFRVIDLVGLVDRDLGQTVLHDRQSLSHYLLQVRKPDGVWLHKIWMGFTGFDTNPAFSKMYAPVWEERASPSSPPTAGFYLRRDLLQNKIMNKVHVGSDS